MLAMYGCEPIDGVFESYGPDKNGHVSKERSMDLMHEMLCAPGGGRAAKFWGVPAGQPH
jgi:hypothetical protein